MISPGMETMSFAHIEEWTSDHDQMVEIQLR